MAIQTRGPRSLDEGSAVAADAIPALARLLDELVRCGIRYCSWKSNEHLAEGLAGRTDLDLLVDANDASRFREILLRRGVKPLTSPPRAAFPGMEHFLGMDPSSGRQFHLHVHDRLVLGERYVKNYRIPMEAEFLRSTETLWGVPIARPDLELGILTVRALLKYRPRDVVKDVLGIRSPGIKQEMQDELRWLLARTTIERVGDALRAGAQAPSPDIAREFLHAFVRDPRSGTDLLRLRTRLRSELRGQRRRGRASATIQYLHTSWDRRRRLRRHPAETRMTIASGGCAVALVGADGSGKSTIADELERWLGWKLQVRRAYLGSKEPSRSSRWSYLAFRALRRGARELGSGPLRVASTPVAAVRDVVLALHHLSIARDRGRRFRDGRRQVHRGRIVIFDRFPLATLSDRPDHRLFDGPQIRMLLGPRMSRAVSALARVEERRYRGFGLPEHLVVLQVSPEVSIGRKPDHRREVLRVKSRAAVELAELAERDGSAHVIRIDANGPLDEVLLDVKRSVWDAL